MESGELNQRTSLSEYLDFLCAYYMMLGVPCDEFWHGDYTMLRYYAKANELRQEQKNTDFWLQGLYIYNGISVAIAQAFGKTDMAYPDKPYDLKEKDAEEETKRIRKETAEKLKRWKEEWEQRQQLTISK